MKHGRTELRYEGPCVDQRFIDDAFSLGDFRLRGLRRQSLDLTEFHADQGQQLSQVIVEVGRQPLPFALFGEIQFGRQRPQPCNS